MISLSPEEAGVALGLAPLSSWVTRVSIDSRSIRPGDLFVALRGERFDGHDFVDAAIAAGASGAVVERGALAWCTGQEVGVPLYEVENTLEALWALARQVRRKSGAIVFAITGSVGKTSTKDLLGAMVGRVRSTVVTSANQNNEVGVPLTLLAIEPHTEAVIVEMGMRGRGQIAALTSVAEPDVGIITNIHPVHLELLGSIEAVAEAKVELLHGLNAGGIAVVPAECRLLQPYMELTAHRVVTFGTEDLAGGADVTAAVGAGEGRGRALLRVHWAGGQAEVESEYLPAHVVMNVAAAAAACYAAGLPVEECARGVRFVEFSGGRGDMFWLAEICVIDDTYNANPAAVRAAVDNLVRVAAESRGRAVAVLGDMLELGPESARYHREAGEYAASVGVRALWGVGPLSLATVEGFQQWLRKRTAEGPGAVSEWVAGHVPCAEETSSVIASLQPGDVVLFKGSRGAHLETMVRRVMEKAGAGTMETR